MLHEHLTDHVIPQMTSSLIDPELEEKLNDIDELIQSKLGLERSNDGRPSTTADTANDFKWGLHSPEFFSHESPSAGSAYTDLKTRPRNEVSRFGVEMEVTILDLKDVYNKKTKKSPDGLKYSLEESEVNVIVQASEEITCVRAYTQRCPDAAIKTHDTIGPVELPVNTLQSDPKCRSLSIDLGSVHKTKDGDPVYWLEKADVSQRNKWELVITLEFISGLSGNVTSRSFRVTTKVGHKMKRKGERVANSCQVQRLYHRIQEVGIHVVGNDDGYWLEHNFPLSSVVNKDDDDHSSLMGEDPTSSDNVRPNNSGSILNSNSPSLVEHRILFQPNTVLDRHAVTQYYGGKQRIHRAVEQPELSGLLRVVGRKTNLQSVGRKANGHEISTEDFWWACGLCFFERRKKSTIKDHLIRQVCQKSIKTRKSKERVAKRQPERQSKLLSL